ncbi:MAG: carotenoid oxygenase family protein [Acidimicrobiales bacterium]
MVDRRDFLRAVAAGGGAAALGLAGTGCALPAPADPLGGRPYGLPHGSPAASPGRDLWARMPAAFNRKVTAEADDLPLSVLEGLLPDDLAGHVFFQSLALGPTDAGLGGDPLIWRLDLDGTAPRITSKLLRTTDYLMGQAFADTPYRFDPHGMMRLGPLGLQNQPNTAFVQMAGNRLFATVDGGRPWEFDPATLRPITPLGHLADYRPMAELTEVNRFLCPMNITSAHPPYDPQTGEYYGASLSIVPLPGMVYFEVLCWSGDGAIKRVPLLTPDLQPLLISQNAHQICVTRDHLVILDAAGTIEFGKLADTPNSWAAGVAAAPRPDSYLYIVSRSELRATTGAAIAQRAIVPRESGHFMVDYDSTPSRLVVHCPHTSASDFAEWVQPYDTHPATGTSVRRDLVNAITPVIYDIGVVGRYEIDATSGAVVHSSMFSNDWTWGTGGLTARNPNTSSSTLGDQFHANSGFPTDLAVERVYTGFTDYPHRLVPTDELPWEGVPSSLVRVDHDAGRVVDGYWFPGDRFAWTPTFVPRNGTATGSADGYIVVVVFSDVVTAASAGTELWVFDAAALSDGPVARLGHPALQVPITLHSTWLESTRSTRPDYRVDVASELLDRAETWRFDPEVLSVLRNDVLPAYDAIVG